MVFDEAITSEVKSEGCRPTSEYYDPTSKETLVPANGLSADYLRRSLISSVVARNAAFDLAEGEGLLGP